MCELFLAGRKNIARSPHAPVLLPVRRARLPRVLAARKARSFSPWSRHCTDTAGYLLGGSSGGIYACKLRAGSLAFLTSVRGFVEQIRRSLVDVLGWYVGQRCNLSIYNFYLSMKIDINFDQSACIRLTIDGNVKYFKFIPISLIVLTLM